MLIYSFFADRASVSRAAVQPAAQHGTLGAEPLSDWSYDVRHGVFLSPISAAIRAVYKIVGRHGDHEG